jgi:hypothetical protein
MEHDIRPSKAAVTKDRRRLRPPAYLPQSTWRDGVKGDPQGRPDGTERSEALDSGTPGATSVLRTGSGQSLDTYLALDRVVYPESPV